MSASASSVQPEDRLLARELAGLVGSVREARWIVEEAAGDEVLARSLAARRAAGLPLQHVLGHFGFRTLDVLTDDRALIPRPETEVVVGVALDELRRLGELRRHDDPGGPGELRRSGEPRLLVADLGTGSGVIACSLVAEAEVPVEVHAVDASGSALALAAENLERTGAGDSVVLHEGSWFDPLPPELAGRLDLVVSNPPYLAEEEWPGLDPVVRDHDPRQALVAGPTGLEDVARVVNGATRWLRPAGSVVVEIAPHQADAAAGLARAAGFVDVRVLPDLVGRPRVLVARLPRSGTP